MSELWLQIVSKYSTLVFEFDVRFSVRDGDPVKIENFKCFPIFFVARSNKLAQLHLYDLECNILPFWIPLVLPKTETEENFWMVIDQYIRRFAFPLFFNFGLFGLNMLGTLNKCNKYRVAFILLCIFCLCSRRYVLSQINWIATKLLKVWTTDQYSKH